MHSWHPWLHFKTITRHKFLVMKYVSMSWLHHKGRNRHHFEHWVDYSLDGEHVIMGARMPKKYVAEMVMDRISASRNYLGDAYTHHEPLDYFLKSKEKLWFIHPQTKKELEGLLRILDKYGEDKALWYIRNVYLCDTRGKKSSGHLKKSRNHR